ncbi:hypothetical protein C8A05DRAFT_39274, partial [Staphylotrichum tortipilum]
MDRVIDIALRVLRHPKSSAALTEMGMELVKIWTHKRFPIAHQGRTLEDMNTALRRFLDRLANDQFYPIRLLDTNRGRKGANGISYAQFVQETWVDPGKAKYDKNGFSKELEKAVVRWDPRKAGYIKVLLIGIETTAQAKWDYEYAHVDRALFEESYLGHLGLWALIMAHELVHAWLSFLAGDGALLTPIEFTPPGHVNSLRGESGRTWEIRALGGMVRATVSTEHRFALRDPCPIRAASLWVEFTKHGEQRRAEVSPEALMDLGRGKVDLPLKMIGHDRSIAAANAQEGDLVGSKEWEWRKDDLKSGRAEYYLPPGATAPRPAAPEPAPHSPLGSLPPLAARPSYPTAASLSSLGSLPPLGSLPYPTAAPLSSLSSLPPLTSHLYPTTGTLSSSGLLGRRPMDPYRGRGRRRPLLSDYGDDLLYDDDSLGRWTREDGVTGQESTHKGGGAAAAAADAKQPQLKVAITNPPPGSTVGPSTLASGSKAAASVRHAPPPTPAGAVRSTPPST